MAAPAPSGLKRFYLVLAAVAVIGVGAMLLHVAEEGREHPGRRGHQP